MGNTSQSYLERAHESKSKESLSRSISENIEISLENNMLLVDSWKKFDLFINDLGFEKKEVDKYLTSASMHHGSEIFVRRGSLHRLLDSLHDKRSLQITAMDQEPNAALLGNLQSSVNGIEVALEGGFGWFVENKVAGVFGFIPHNSSFHSDSVHSGASLSKQGAHLMRRIEGSIESDEVLFLLLRIHKSAYPEDLLIDEDFDNVTGEKKSFILRLYAKNHRTH